MVVHAGTWMDERLWVPDQRREEVGWQRVDREDMLQAIRRCSNCIKPSRRLL